MGTLKELIRLYKLCKHPLVKAMLETEFNLTKKGMLAICPDHMIDEMKQLELPNA